MPSIFINGTEPTLILASGSPRRRELLAGCGIKFEIEVPNSVEDVLPDEEAEHMVKRLSRRKAEAVMRRHPDRWVLAADTTVVLDGKIYNKPENPAEAVSMLEALQGRQHTVWGGVTLGHVNKQVMVTEAFKSLVEIMPLSSAVIKAYVQTGEPLDKAGAYAIQGIGTHLVKSVTGSYTNVVGLDLQATIQMLLKHKVIAYVSA